MEEFDMAVQCRACLSTNSSEYIDMESSMVGENSYLECFNICTNLKASTADQLPIIICTVCSHDLQIAFDFLQMARQADEELRQIQAAKLKVEHFEEEEIERLEYVDGDEEVIVAINEDEEEEHILPLEMEEDEEVEELELIAEDEGEDQYRELETIDEQGGDGIVMEQECLEEKPHVEEFIVELEESVTDKECNSKLSNLKEEQQDIQESYPEDEIDDEYLLEHNAMAKAESPQGWKCFECKRMLHSDVSYEGHLNMHKNVKPYKCTHCRSTFRCRNALEHHASKRHEQGKTAQKCFTCDICDKPFRLATLLLEHRRSEHKTLLSCSKCTKYFKSQELLDEHMTLIHPPTNTTPIQCPFCAQPPLTKARLVEHLRQQHPAEHRKHLHTVGRPCDENKVTPWQCEECFRYYRTESLLKDHSNSHTNERPHSCSVCDKRFFTANNLRSHMRSMHQAEYEKRMAESLDSIVKCEICKKKLLQKNLEKHMLTHERKEKQTEIGGGSTAKYLCAYCPQEFYKPTNLALHEEGAHLLKKQAPKHSCKECGKKFFQHKHLQAHLSRVHTHVRKHACDICGNAFKGRSQLCAHMKLHMEKNLNCQHCDKKYARRADLTVHMRTHTGELPYACHLCNKRFAIKVRLTYHLQRHEGVQHPCSHCDAVYDNRNKLKEHMFRHTGMPYRCEVCPGVEFSRRLRFINHMTRAHERRMTDEELAQMFAKNTGKVIRFKQLDGNKSENSDYCQNSQDSQNLQKNYNATASTEEDET